MKLRAELTVLGVLLLMPAMAQTRRLAQGPHRMELTLERYDGVSWRSVDPGRVFASGDRIRFRFRTNFSGFLYVMNQGTGGSYTQLFPTEEAGLQNRVEPEQEYYIPATKDGSFRIAGPAGHDVIYWMVTPAAIGAPHQPAPLPPPPPLEAVPPPSMTPRCDDAIFRARGDCIDASAGPKPVLRGQSLPANLEQVKPAASEDFVFLKSQNRSVVTAQSKLTGPVVFEYRLAHR
ncbi:MAG: DUF4384 domain-containing protein [Bryobacteraceae bacterium]|nr:DUF4384 domain-containing protein [Bryobacteraceae bacterium]MDW8380452.1 DUF4384 domain-containing protein [Bryobacterales bacterium]